MKRILSLALALFCATSFGATLNPIQLLNPAGSTSGQAIVSSGPTSAPAWTTITPAAIGGLKASNNLSDVASATAALANLGGLSATTAAATYATITNLNLKAPLASPVFTGVPVTTTAALHTATTQIASTGFVINELSSPPSIGVTTPNSGAFSTISATGSITPSQTAGIIGTTTNNNANTGSVGEYPTPTNLTNVPLTSGSASNVSSISLSAGDYEISGSCHFTPAGTTTVTTIACGVGTTSNTLGAAPNITQMNGSFVTGFSQDIGTPQVRVLISATTTVYLTALSGFGTSTATANGYLHIRRVR